MKNYYHISFMNLWKGTDIEINKIKFHKSAYRFIDSRNSRISMNLNNHSIIDIIHDIKDTCVFGSFHDIKVKMYKHDLLNVLELLKSEDTIIIRMGLEIIINNEI